MHCVAKLASASCSMAEGAALCFAKLACVDDICTSYSSCLTALAVRASNLLGR